MGSLIAVLLFDSGTVRGQLGPAAGGMSPTGAVTGTVTDLETGDPLPYVSVVAVQTADASGDVPAENEAFRKGASTTEEGTYRIDGLPPGRFQVTFTCIGYVRETRDVGVSPTVSAATLSVALSFEAIPFEGVDVTADRFARDEEVQTGFVSIAAERLAEIPSIGEPDPIRSLQLLPGIQAASDISSGLYVRGGGPDQTLVLLDHVPIYNPTHAFGFFSTFNSDGIDKVTLYKGAYPAEYGGRLGAVLDVTNRAGSRDQFKGQARLSTIAGRVTIEGPVGSGSYLLSARRTYLDPFLDAIRTEDNPIPDYYFYDLNGKLVLDSSDRQSKWVFSGYTGRDDLFFDLDEDSFFEIRWGNRMFTAGYERFLGETALAELYLSTSEYESLTDVEIFTTPFSFTNRLRDYSLRADISWDATPNHRLSGGILGTLYDFYFAQSFNEDSEVQLDTSPGDVSIFLQDEWSPNDIQTIRVGGRARWFSDGNRFFFEPRISFSRQVAERVRWKWGAGLYNQYLQLVSTEGFSAADFYIPIDETTRPGRSYQTVTGIDWDISERYRMSIETYFTGLDNLVLFDNDVASDNEDTNAEGVFKTGGDGFATGVEVFAEQRTGPLTGWIGYTLGWTRRTFAELNQGESFPPKYDRRHDLSVVGKYERGKWSYGASLVYATGQAFTAASARWGVRNPATGLFDPGLVLPSERNSARLLPYHRLDVSVARQFQLFGQEAEWMLQVFNLYSRRNEWFVQYTSSDENPSEPEVVKQLPIIPTLGVSFAF